MTITVEEEKLNDLIQKAVEEAFDRKMMQLRLQLLPYVSDKEQKEIEEMFGEDPGEEDVARTIILERK